MKCLNRFLLAMIYLIVMQLTASAQNPLFDSLPWGTNNEVNSLLLSGDTLYFGGSFSWVGPVMPYGATVDLITAQADINMVRANNAINAVVSDGADGWFIGGTFTQVGGQPRNYLARINSDGTLHPWNPNANGAVQALTLSGNTLYVGGSFTEIGSQTRNRIAAFNINDGLLTSWNPIVSSTVQTIVLDGNMVYIGGLFNNVNGSTRNRIARIDASTGDLDAWSPSVTLQVMDCFGKFPRVNTIAINDTAVIFGGYFNRVNGQVREHLASVKKATGTLSQETFNVTLDWENETCPEANVRIIKIHDGQLYIGGLFNLFGPFPRNGLAKINLATNSLTSWDPNPNNIITTSFEITNNTMYVSGGFTSIGGQARNQLAAVNLTTGNATSWNPKASSSYSTMAIYDNKLFLGNSVTNNVINGENRNGLASYILSAGTLTSWNPGANSSVLTMDKVGNTLYIGGGFTQVGGQTRNRLAAIDVNTGLPTSWNPNANNLVYSLIAHGDSIYVGGVFTTVGGQTRNRIAELKMSNGTATTWNPNADLVVRSLLIDNNTIFVGGDFQNIGGQPRNRIAALNLSSGNATSWNPNANNTVKCLKLNIGSIYAGGSFTQIGGQTRNRIASIDISTGAATTWNPNADGEISDIVITGDIVFIGGEFSNIGGQAKNKLAAIDKSSGALNAWNAGVSDPDFGSYIGNGTVRSLLVYDTKLIAAGGFSRFEGKLKHFIASADISVLQTNITTNPFSGNRCKEAAFNVYYTTSHSFNVGNVFTAQLYKPGDSLFIPVNIGSLSSITSGMIPVNLPSAITGTGFRIRVLGSNPNIIGTDNGTNFSIIEILTPSVTIALTEGEQGACPGNQITFTATPVNGGNFPLVNWFVDEISIQTGAMFSSNSLQDGQQVYATMVSTYFCPDSPLVTSNIIELSVGVPTTWYADEDGDGYGDNSNSILTCEPSPEGYVTNNTDCDDTNPNINPGLSEVCGNGIDDNCNSEIDEACCPTFGSLPQIIGSANQGCDGVSGVTYTLPPVAAADGYNWISTGGITITDGHGTNEITVDFPAGFTVGTVRVRAYNDCYLSAERVLTVRAIASNTPGAISGASTNICGNSSESYSISSVANTDSYEWAVVGTGASIQSGQGTQTSPFNLHPHFPPPSFRYAQSTAAVPAVGEAWLSAQAWMHWHPRRYSRPDTRLSSGHRDLQYPCHRRCYRLYLENYRRHCYLQRSRHQFSRNELPDRLPQRQHLRESRQCLRSDQRSAHQCYRHHEDTGSDQWPV
jgi:trimeric autotransporter adhesin